MVDTGRLKTDLFALVVLAAAVFLGLSLASYDPADPPAHGVYPLHRQVTNLCGEIGAPMSNYISKAGQVRASGKPRRTAHRGAHYWIHERPGRSHQIRPTRCPNPGYVQKNREFAA